MTSRISIAVVITNFNYGRYLGEAIESTLAQTMPFDEIVVVDDGSTDESGSVLDSFEGRITILRQSNSGHWGAAAAGFERTSSDYVVFLDADDYLAPHFVAGVLPHLSEHQPAKLQCQLWLTDSDGKTVGSSFPTYPAGYDAAAARADNATLGVYLCVTTSGNVFKSSALRQLGPHNFPARTAPDHGPAWAMPYLGELISLNEPLGAYRIHANSASTWGNPTVRSVRRELAYFEEDWPHIQRALSLPSPFGKGKPLWVLEREMMLSILAGDRFLRTAPACAARILASRLTFRHKVLLSGWVMTLFFSPRRFRTALMLFRRSAVNRPRLLQSLIRRVFGKREVANSAKP